MRVLLFAAIASIISLLLPLAALASASGSCPAGQSTCANSFLPLSAHAESLKAKSGKTIEQLRAMGIDALVKKDLTMSDLRLLGFDLAQIRDNKNARDKFCYVGLLSASHCKATKFLDSGFSLKDLRLAGYSASDLHSSGLTLVSLKEAGFSCGDLRKEFAESNILVDLIESVHCSLSELKEARYGPKDLRPHFKLASLKGLFSVKELAEAFTIAEFRAG